MNLTALDQKTAELVQRGLASLDLYSGTFKGIPGPKTQAAYDTFINGGTANTIAKSLISLATKELGVRESPINSNKGPRVEEYQAATWLPGTGWPWCAAFICWLCREAGVKNRPQTAGAWDFENWAKDPDTPGQILDPKQNEIKGGDILVFTFSHIGLAANDEYNDQVRTIEGNTDASGSREGGGVYFKIRKKDKVRSIIRIK